MATSHRRPSATASADAPPPLGGVDLALHLLREALAIADRAVLADIECEAVAEHIEGQRWYDTRPMLDQREYPDDVVEMNRQALDYAHQRGLVSPHPEQAHLVRITKATA